MDSLVPAFPVIGIKASTSLNVPVSFIKHTITRASGTYRTRVAAVNGNGPLVSHVRNNNRGTTISTVTPVHYKGINHRSKYGALYSLMLCNLAKTTPPVGL